jgi:hypothetical protein
MKIPAIALMMVTILRQMIVNFYTQMEYEEMQGIGAWQYNADGKIGYGREIF